MQKLIKLEPMRNILAFMFLFSSLLVYPQGHNPFADNDDQTVIKTSPQENPVENPPHQYENPNAAPAEIKASDDPGNPGDVVPIDDYLPLLLITAVGIIVHAGCRKRKQTA